MKTKIKETLTQDVDFSKAKEKSKGFFTEFKEFAVKGNVMDMAIGVIIGGAFGKIVTSFVNDIIMPAVSLLTGKMDFTNLFIALDGNTYETLEIAKEAGVATLNYGSFLTTVIDFLLIALSIFIIMKKLLVAKKKEEAPAPVTTKECPYCKSTIALGATRCPHCTSELN